MQLTPRFVARSIAAGRVLYGVACMAAPKVMLGPGGFRTEGPAVWMVRAFGVRDVVLGSGTLMALAEPSVANARRWVGLSAAADGADVANALLFRKDLDRTGMIGALAIAVPAATAGAWAVNGLYADES